MVWRDPDTLQIGIDPEAGQWRYAGCAARRP